MKIKKPIKKSKGHSVQDLMGIQRFTRYGLLTDEGETLFYLVNPINISVLSHANVEGKIVNLQKLFAGKPELEFFCTDAAECFDANKAYLQGRIETEPNPAVRDLLKRDYQFLDRMQVEMATARQFFFIFRCKDMKESQVFQTANEVEKAIAGNGFEVRRLNRSEIKRLLALYFDASLYGEHLPDIDGEQYLTVDTPEPVTSGRKRKEKPLTPEQAATIRTKDFFDCILPGTIKFQSDHYIVGNSYRSVWALREYPPTTEEQAIFARLADRSGVTMRMYLRRVSDAERNKIINHAQRRNRMKSGSNDLQETVEAEGNLQDVIDMLMDLNRQSEYLLHCAVFIELKAKTPEALSNLQSEVNMELLRSKLSMSSELSEKQEKK